MKIFQERIKTKSKADIVNIKYISTDDLEKLKKELVSQCGILSASAGIKEIQKAIYDTFEEMIK